MLAGRGVTRAGVTGAGMTGVVVSHRYDGLLANLDRTSIGSRCGDGQLMGASGQCQC